uniref:SRPBCC family protein n=1 Tax=Gelidibacter sp. TaxID=2018083 RepID=UPI00404B7C87
MNYTTEIIVEVPLDTFVKIMDNPENMKHWQRGLISFEHISGTPGEFGAKMKLNFKMGKRHLELIETITKRNFPNEFHAFYSTKGADNFQENYFEETPEGFTKWTSKSEFVPLGLTMKLLTVFMKSVFKKQSLQYMKDFKNYAEKGISISNATT